MASIIRNSRMSLTWIYFSIATSRSTTLWALYSHFWKTWSSSIKRSTSVWSPASRLATKTNEMTSTKSTPLTLSYPRSSVSATITYWDSKEIFLRIWVLRRLMVFVGLLWRYWMSKVHESMKCTNCKATKPNCPQNTSKPSEHTVMKIWENVYLGLSVSAARKIRQALRITISKVCMNMQVV